MADETPKASDDPQPKASVAPVETVDPLVLQPVTALKGGIGIKPIGYDLYCTRNNPIDETNNISIRRYDLYKKSPETQDAWVKVSGDVIPYMAIPVAYEDNGDPVYANQAIVQGPVHAGMTVPTATDASVPVYYYARDMSQDGYWGDFPTYDLDVNRLIPRALYRTNDLTLQAGEVACDGMVPNLDHVLFMGKGRLAYQKNKFRDDSYPYFNSGPIDSSLYICNFDPMILKKDSSGNETIIGVAQIPVQFFTLYEGVEAGSHGTLPVSTYLPGDDTPNPLVSGGTLRTPHVIEWTLKMMQYSFLGETGLLPAANALATPVYPIDGVFGANGLPYLDRQAVATATVVDSDTQTLVFSAAPLGQPNYVPRYTPQSGSGNTLQLAYIAVYGVVTNIHYVQQTEYIWGDGHWDGATWISGSYSGPYGTVSGDTDLIGEVARISLGSASDGRPITYIYFNEDSVPVGEIWFTVVVSAIPHLKTLVSNPTPPPAQIYIGTFKDVTASDLAVFTDRITADFVAGNYNGHLLANRELSVVSHDPYWWNSAYPQQTSLNASAIVSCPVTAGGGIINFDTILNTGRGFISDRIIAVTGADGEKVCASLPRDNFMSYSTDFGNTFQNCASNNPNLYYTNLLAKRVGTTQSLFVVVGTDRRIGGYFLEPKYPDIAHFNASDCYFWYSSDGGRKWTSLIKDVEPLHIIVAAEDKVVMVVPKTAPTYGSLYPLVETVLVYTEYRPDFTTVRYCEVAHNITSVTSIEFETRYLDIDGATYLWHASDKVGGFTPDTQYPNRVYINSLIDPVDIPYFSTEVRVTYIPAENDTVGFPTTGWDPPGMLSYIYEAIELDLKTKEIIPLGDLPKEWGSPIGDWGGDQPSWNSFSILVNPESIYGTAEKLPDADPLIAYRARDAAGNPITNSTKVQRAGVPLSFGVFASGGTSPLTWSTPTPLPSWLSFSTSGVFTGTPPSTSFYEVSVECVVTDSSKPPVTARTTVLISIIL